MLSLVLSLFLVFEVIWLKVKNGFKIEFDINYFKNWLWVVNLLLFVSLCDILGYVKLNFLKLN